MKRFLRVQLAGIAFLTAVSGLLTGAASGDGDKSGDGVKLGQLANRVPPGERFVFSQQLLNGVVRGLDPEDEADLKTLNAVADRWTDWVCHSVTAGPESEKWQTLVRTASAEAMRKYEMPLIVDDANDPRLTALTLPIDLDAVRELEMTYVEWNRDRKDVNTWGNMQSLFPKGPGDHVLPGARENFASRLDGLYSNPTARRWNDLMYSAGDFKWSRRVFDDSQQKMQIDRGVQRVLLAFNWDNDDDRSQASKLGREYWKSQATNEPGYWAKLVELLSQLASEKRLETVVTFATRNSKGATKDATVAYRIAAGKKPDRTIQLTVKINSGVYEVWSERDDKPTSAKLVHRIFSDAIQIPIRERDDATP